MAAARTVIATATIMLLASSCTNGRTRDLTASFLTGDRNLAAPVQMQEFAAPDDESAPNATFSGSLRLVSPDQAGEFRVLTDDYGRENEIGEPLYHLPEFDFKLVQRGRDLVPLRRGVIRRDHPYWEIILQPGRVWQQDEDGNWTRASLPFALQERSANCTHNGVMTWLFDETGRVSRVAYQISSETCGYLKFDMWGVVAARYLEQALDAQAAPQLARLDAHRSARLPVRPLADLSDRFPGVDTTILATGDGIPAEDLTVYGIVVDASHYRSDCATRHGLYPYCDSLPLPSYSTAKSVFAGVATMRLEKLHPGVSQQTVASLVSACNLPKWRDVTIQHALDMTTGNFDSAVHSEDEDSKPHEAFIFSDSHAERLGIACNLFDRQTDPGSQFVYHTSDTYLVGAALSQFVTTKNDGADLYEDVLVKPIWRELELSPLLDDTKRTYDAAAQSFTGYGLTYEADDIVRIAKWLATDDALLDDSMRARALQRDEDDRGIETGMANLNYNNGFWAFNAGLLLGCDKSVWVPFMSGISGITVALFPNGVIYYYFSDSYVFRWHTAISAVHEIESLC